MTASKNDKKRSTGRLVLLAVGLGAVAGAVGALVGHVFSLSADTTAVISTAAGSGVITYLVTQLNQGD